MAAKYTPPHKPTADRVWDGHSIPLDPGNGTAEKRDAARKQFDAECAKIAREQLSKQG